MIYRIPDPQYSRYRVVHRIVEKLPDGRYMAQGDNQDHPDPWVIPHGNIVGGQVAAIAKGGYLLSYLRNPIYLGLAFACLVTFLFWPSKECETSEATSAMVGGMHTDELNVVAPVPALAVVEAATRTERVEHRDNVIVLTEDAPGLRPASWVVGLPTRPESDVDVFIREWISACSDDREHLGAEACGRSRDRGLRSEAVLV